MHLPTLLKWIALLALLPAWAAYGQAVRLPSVDVALVEHAMPLRERLLVMRDASARLGPTAAMARPAWRALTASGMNSGYSSDAVWLRGTLRNSSGVTLMRWLVVGSPRLEDVSFYVLRADDALVLQAIRSGTLVPMAQRPVVSHLPLFPVTLAPGQAVDFAVRIASHSALDLNMTLWEPSAFRQDEGRELAVQAVLISLPLLLVLYTLIQGVVWRDRAFVLMAAWIAVSLCYMCAFQGYLYRFVFPAGGPWIVHGPATFAGAASLLYAWLSCMLVGIHQIRCWKWIYALMAVAIFAVTIWAALGDYRAAAPVSNASIALFYLLWIASMLHGWRRGLPNAGLFVSSFALVWLGMCWKILEFNGLIDRSLLSDWQLSWLFQLGLLPMMSLMVARRACELHRQHKQMQRAILDARAQEQVRLEHAVAERTHELREALLAADEANHAKTDFLARISHDLRTPLTSILGFADMVQASGSDNAGHGRIIRRSAHHMLNMVNDLIDYARGDQGDSLQPAPVYAHALLNTVAHEGAELARRNHNHFSLRISPSLPPVLQLDARRLHRILGNLLDNAAKYTRDGNIELSVNCAPHGEKAGTVMLELGVGDSGCGIAPEFHARIFEPFERADASRSAPGIGLGLAIVLQWVTRMGGSIDTDSTPGLGTLMTLRLPAQVGDEHDIARHHVLESTDMTPLIDGRGLVAWVVEDSPDIGRLLTDQLSSLGFAVEVWTDGAAAIGRMERQETGRPHLIVTDYLLPGAGGGQVLQAARRLLPGVPVLLLSATPMPARSADDRAPDFDARLLKPVNFLQLQDAIGQLLGLSKTAAPEPVAPEPDVDDQALLLPPEPALRSARAMIELGAISDLIDWADALIVRYPECDAFHQRARQYIIQGNLAVLEQLCRR